MATVGFTTSGLSDGSSYFSYNDVKAIGRVSGVESVITQDLWRYTLFQVRSVETGDSRSQGTWSC